MTTDTQRFWAKVVIGDDCWEWEGNHTRGKRNYGLFWVGSRWMRAHRWSWEERNGPIPDGLKVCHHCDNPRCVRPDHLFLGTQRENLEDMDRKNRRYTPFRGQVQVGEANRAARLTDELVREVRRLSAAGHYQKDIAEQFGVDRSTISHVVRGKTWRHVD